MARRSPITPGSGRRCQLRPRRRRGLYPDAEFVLTGTFSVAPTEGPRWRSTPARSISTARRMPGSRDDPADGLCRLVRRTTSPGPIDALVAQDLPRLAGYYVPGSTAPGSRFPRAGPSRSRPAPTARPDARAPVSRGRGRQPSGIRLDRLHPLGLPSTTSIRRLTRGPRPSSGLLAPPPAG